MNSKLKKIRRKMVFETGPADQFIRAIDLDYMFRHIERLEAKNKKLQSELEEYKKPAYQPESAPLDYVPELEECEKCSGSGFDGYGTGYNNVCGNCTGGYTGYKEPKSL